MSTSSLGQIRSLRWILSLDGCGQNFAASRRFQPLAVTIHAHDQYEAAAARGQSQLFTTVDRDLRMLESER